jgi:lipopolysaccharide/colanic/teichoic acid biosynthesis glycosyltransferase
MVAVAYTSRKPASPQAAAKRDVAFYDAAKRLADFAVAAVGLVALSPLLAVLALAVRVSSPGPILYKGLRAGKGGRPFLIYKFRSMHVDADKGAGTTSRNDPRVTRVGAFLRRFKLDELPQLLNVLKGDMSFVGPRPELLRYTEAYIGREKLILSVRPGITDIASLRFADLGQLIDDADPDASFEARILPEKNRLRLEYVETRGIVTDTTILIRTVGLVLGRIFRRKS